ncbi:MAG: 1-hydroxycarotenoid 3,4-desaturase CrtD [Henriciella sp.]
MSPSKKVIVIGAGAGGLAAAMDLSAADMDVTVVEKELAVGGKMRHLQVGGAAIDGGPTVFTMRWVFEGLFQRSGRSLEAEIKISSAERLARHAWRDGSQLDLWTDIDRSAEAIADFSDQDNADGYRSFCKDSQAVFETLRDSFIAAQKPNPISLGLRIGLHRFDKLWQTRPFETYWSKLQRYFSDPRLRQLFGRYSTYIGSSPYLTPATLMLIAHVEQDGVWLVEGGMHAVALAMQRAAEGNGAQFRFGARVAQIETDGGAVSGITLDSGERLPADLIVFNGDQSAIGEGLLGPQARPSATKIEPGQRSLSAIVTCTHAKTSGFELDYHTVFFSDDYKREFDQVFEARTPPQDPTIYICAQDRSGEDRPVDRERLLILVNAPADGDHPSDRLNWSEAKTRDLLARYGLQLEPDAPFQTTDPMGFHTLFPGTGGALYGAANHSPFATFARKPAKSKIKGLYFAGGSIHPGAGVPMATMSGQLAAQAILAR